jgi:hypothetical protein
MTVAARPETPRARDKCHWHSCGFPAGFILLYSLDRRRERMPLHTIGFPVPRTLMRSERAVPVPGLAVAPLNTNTDREYWR